MATSYKVLGQINPSATTTTNVYVVPAATSAVVSSLMICNQGGSGALVNVLARPNNEAVSDKHLILKSFTIPASDTYSLQIGITLQTGAILAANANSSTVSFSAFGAEVT